MAKQKWLALVVALGMLSILLAPAAPARAQNSRFFPETGKTVAGRFLQYWLDNGGLAQQGYPISDELQEVSTVNGQSYSVQYFERAVFEKHPENAAPYDVLLSLLGSSLYKRNYPTGAPGQQASTDNPRYFAETGHTVGGAFRQYWEQHGGLAQQGLPLSDEFQEQSLTDGKTYTVQYFERAVFEYHPENNPPFNVLLSLLGRFSYGSKAGGSQPPTNPTTPPASDPTATPGNPLAGVILTEFKTEGSPVGIVAGPDGQIWFADSSANKIGRIDLNGAVTEIAIPSTASQPQGIIIGSNDRPWFAEYNANKIAYVAANDSIVEYPVGSPPEVLTMDSDDRIWIAFANSNQIGYLKADGTVEKINIPTPNSMPSALTEGPEHHIWFSEFRGNKIGYVDDDNSIVEFPIPTPQSSPGALLYYDQKLWFTEVSGKIAYFDPSTFRFYEFEIPTAKSAPSGLALGPDARIWFTESGGNKIGVLDLDGTIVELALPTPNSGPNTIAFDFGTSSRFGAIWFTEYNSKQVGRLLFPAPPPR